MRGKFKKDYWIIKFSRLFDPVYYLKQYPDVRRADIDPLEHFVIHGWKEGRKPNEWFNTREYLEKNPDVAKAGINPFVHWIRYGRFEGRFPYVSSDFKNMNSYNLVLYLALLKFLKDPKLIIKFLKKIKQTGFKSAFQMAKQKLIQGSDYSLWLQMYDTITEEDKKKIKEHISKLKNKPTFSIIMPVYNTPERYLREAIESVINQIYPYWELCIADDASTEKHVKKILEEYKSKDSRIKVIYRDRQGHISEASNSALSLATGEYVGFLDHDDVLAPHALYMVALEINKHPEANLIYSDEDKIGENGNRYDPYFKPDWNYELFLGQNYICHFLVVKKSLIEKVGGFRKGFEGAQDWDLALRIIEKIPYNTIRHIPFILYHWRVHSQSTASSIQAKPYAKEAQYKALTEHLKRIEVNADLQSILEVHWRVKCKLEKFPFVSIIIPTKDRRDLLEKCIFSILEKTNYPAYEILIVNNRSELKETFEFFAMIAEKCPDKIKIIDYDKPFNWSAINNYATQFAKGELFLFLNNDTEVKNSDWLEEMVSYTIKDEVGIVGAKLYYPNETIQHAGVILGIGGFAGHAFRHFPKNSPGYFARLVLSQELSAVTGACLLVKRNVFTQVGGFDESFAVAFNDVDFCIRVGEAGYKIIFTPYAELYHYEGISRGIDTLDNSRFRREIAMMQRKWGELLYKDPAYNPNLTLEKEDFSLSFPPRVKKPWYDFV